MQKCEGAGCIVVSVREQCTRAGGHLAFCISHSSGSLPMIKMTLPKAIKITPLGHTLRLPSPIPQGVPRGLPPRH